MNDLCDQENMVKIIYRGPVGVHVVPSPLRKVRNYGMHTYGDVFCVHFSDQEANPTLFELYEEPTPAAAPVTEEKPKEEVKEEVKEETKEEAAPTRRVKNKKEEPNE